MANGRARAGGERGMNGEMYAGGQFLPNTQLPKRCPAARRGGPRRALIEPGVLAEIPEGQNAIFAAVRAVCNIENGVLVPFAADHPVWNGYADYEQVQADCSLYNQGQRFYDLP